MGFPGLRFLHPFDSYRARRSYAYLCQHTSLPTSAQPGTYAGIRLVAPTAPLLDQDFELVHSPEYLKSLRKSLVVATAIEVLPFALTPIAFLDWCLVNPMRWASAGTLLACREALEHGLCFSLTGGFHHAKPERGEGFCLFSDIGYAILKLRQEGKVSRVLYVDLDAHQGNGVCAIFRDDPELRIFDVFNGDIYPYGEEDLKERIDCATALEMESGDEAYEQALQKLPAFLEQNLPAQLLIYNAGSDIVSGDRLGGLAISPHALLERDRKVIGWARQLGLPTVFLPSGGYTEQSYRLVADSLLAQLSDS
jgi:histone deacetylase 11